MSALKQNVSRENLSDLSYKFYKLRNLAESNGRKSPKALDIHLNEFGFNKYANILAHMKKN